MVGGNSTLEICGEAHGCEHDNVRSLTHPFQSECRAGESEVPKSQQMGELRQRLEWVTLQQDPVAADLYEDGWHLQPEEARARLIPFLEANGYNGAYAMALADFDRDLAMDHVDHTMDRVDRAEGRRRP